MESLTQAWRDEALRRFPELLDRFMDADTPYLLWIELHFAFVKAYTGKCLDEDMIRRIYAYADWCCSQPQGETAEDDLGTCVVVCFYEHIPQTPAALDDMPHWFSYDAILLMKEVFSYHVGEEGYKRILERFRQNKKAPKLRDGLQTKKMSRKPRRKKR